MQSAAEACSCLYTRWILRVRVLNDNRWGITLTPVVRQFVAAGAMRRHGDGAVRAEDPV